MSPTGDQQDDVTSPVCDAIDLRPPYNLEIPASRINRSEQTQGSSSSSSSHNPRSLIAGRGFTARSPIESINPPLLLAVSLDHTWTCSIASMSLGTDQRPLERINPLRTHHPVMRCGGRYLFSYSAANDVNVETLGLSDSTSNSTQRTRAQIFPP